MKSAILLTHLDWACNHDVKYISKGIYFQNSLNTKVFNLYEKLCYDLQFHDGEADDITTQIIIDVNISDEGFYYWHSPFSLISVLCNIISISIGYPIPSYSIIFSKDNFKTNWGVPIELHNRYDLLETLAYTRNYTDEVKEVLHSIKRNFKEDFILIDERVDEIKLFFKNKTVVDKGKRINNAFDFFFNAWHSFQMDQTCINLAIVLESLFSPTNQMELTHQISFNASQFLGDDKEEKRLLYKLFKRFYSLRSKIVHGNIPDHKELFVVTSVIFILCSEILKKIYLDIGIAKFFIEDKKRSELFSNWMFS